MNNWKNKINKLGKITAIILMIFVAIIMAFLVYECISGIIGIVAPTETTGNSSIDKLIMPVIVIIFIVGTSFVIKYGILIEKVLYSSVKGINKKLVENELLENDGYIINEKKMMSLK